MTEDKKELYLEYIVKCFKQDSEDGLNSQITISIEPNKRSFFPLGGFTPTTIAVPKQLEGEMLNIFEQQLYQSLRVLERKFDIYAKYREAVSNNDQEQILLQQELFKIFFGESIDQYNKPKHSGNNKKGRPSNKPDPELLKLITMEYIELRVFYKRLLKKCGDICKYYKQAHNVVDLSDDLAKQVHSTITNIYLKEGKSLSEEDIQWAINKYSNKTQGDPTKRARQTLKDLFQDFDLKTIGDEALRKWLGEEQKLLRTTFGKK